MDYESLIPYLSESMKQNYNDIKNLKSETEQICRVLDKLYGEFVMKQLSMPSPTSNPPSVVKVSKSGLGAKWLLLVSVCVILIVASIGVFFVLSTKPDPPIQEITPVDHNIFKNQRARTVLLDLYNSTNGQNWHVNNGWATTTPHCSWYGIYCEDDSVSRISLQQNNLVGTIPDSLGDLDSVSLIDLAYNRLFGTIPHSLTFLPNLYSLNISTNTNLSGRITRLANLPAVVNLDLSGCNFEGAIPEELMQITSLARLNLSSNVLTGTIPSPKHWISWMDLSSNMLRGTIPDIHAMSEINLSNNRLTGNTSGLTFSLVQVLDLSNNQLSGDFWLAEQVLEKLIRLNISHNNFTTMNALVIPNSTAVESCDASKNNFECPLHEWMAEKCKATCR